MAGIPFKMNAHGQCRLEKDGSNLKLSLYNGNNLVIDGKSVDIPAAGVTLAATGLTAGTTYYIYAFESGSDIALEASTTTHAVGASGIEVKSGDESRTLVGMARAITGPAWEDSDANRFVASWFNRKPKGLANHLTVTRAITSSTYVEINSEIRVEFLTWDDEAVDISSHGNMWNDGGGFGSRCTISFDGTTAEIGSSDNAGNGANEEGPACSRRVKILSEGYQFATLMGRRTNGGGTSRFGGTSIANESTNLTGNVMQ